MEVASRGRKARFIGFFCLGASIVIQLVAIGLTSYSESASALLVAIPVSMMLLVVGVVCLAAARKQREAPVPGTDPELGRTRP